MDDLYREFELRRKDFPSLDRTYNGHVLAYFDGPGGTQVPKAVMDAVTAYFTNCNANSHGYFVTTMESDRLIAEARNAVAAFLGAEGGNTISFGQNMTTLNYALSRAMERSLRPGDEVLITQLDHEANRGPWLRLRERGVIVREVKLLPNGTLNMDDFRKKITENTRLVAMGFSSNALGTVNDVATVRRWTYDVGAYLSVDAVHYAPHFSIDVKSLGVDFLLCSAYKFYGPHVGILYAREGLLEQLDCERVCTQDHKAPYRIETGTLNHEGIAGVKAAIEYISTYGKGNTLREKLVSAMEKISSYEHELALYAYKNLGSIPGVTIYGPHFDGSRRAPTISFTLEGHDPIQVCKHLNEEGILAWDGHFYAIRPVEILGLLESGGLTRIGISLYNTKEEVDRLVDAVKGLSAR